MSSANKTPFLGLNQWQGNEFPKRDDFNSDNLNIENKIKEHATQLSDIMQQQTIQDNNINAVSTNYKNQVPYGGTTTGSANTYVIATPTITALTVGMAISLKFNVDSTGASTLNWCGKGAKGIKKSNGTDVINLKASGIYTLRYDGTNFILQGEGGSGDALTSDLRSGKKASTDVGDIVGTLDLSLLIPENIRNGVTIDGKTGNVTIASLGGSQRVSGTFTRSASSSVTIPLPFTPDVVITMRSDGYFTNLAVNISGWYYKEVYVNNGSVQQYTTGNNKIDLVTNGFYWHSAGGYTDSFYYLAIKL